MSDTRTSLNIIPGIGTMKLNSTKQTIKLVKRIIKDPDKRKMYSSEELAYMEMQYLIMKLQRKRKKEEKRRLKGFGN